MNHCDSVMAYAERARTVGTRVECMAPADLPGRLATFLGEVRGAWEKVGCAADAGRHQENGGQSSSKEAAPLTALPEQGWPPGVREMVESSLAACGFQIVSPRRVSEGYTWDRDQLAAAALGITFCASYLADTGSLVVPAGPGYGTLASLLPEVHLALSYPEGCLAGLGEYLSNLAGVLPSRFTLITGPSRTGDIEATMTTGVHGPREVHHWILADPHDG